MPGVVLLVAAVVVNFIRHKMGLTTICQTYREHVPRPLGVVILLSIFGWLLPHVFRGYDK